MQSTRKDGKTLGLGVLRIASARAERYSTIRRFFVAQAKLSAELDRAATGRGHSRHFSNVAGPVVAHALRHAIDWKLSSYPRSSGGRKLSQPVMGMTIFAARYHASARGMEKDGLGDRPPEGSSTAATPDSSPGSSPSTEASDTSQPPLPNQPHPPPPDHSYYAPFIRRLLKRVPQIAYTSQPGTNPSSSTPYQIRPETNSLTPPHIFDNSSSGQPGKRIRPPTSQQPTKAELLAASTSVWQRLLIRWRWFSIRGWRRFNVDEWSAFLSWFVVGNTLWVVIGTTTFFSAVFATLNSLSLQSYVGRWLSDYLTRNTGFNVIFESAIVPKWGASTISFRNVYVSRRPIVDEEEEEEVSDVGDDHLSAGGKVLKAIRSRITAYTQDTESTGRRSSRREPTLDEDGNIIPRALPVLTEEEEDDARRGRLRLKNNYTMFDLNFDEVEVTFSLTRLLDGKGLVKDAKIRGVRGVVDRRHVFWDTTVPLVPANFRHPTKHGDFELESLMVEDFLVTVYQPGGQRPFNVSFFTAAIGAFRKRWMFYDLMSADGITGQYDNCLFSLHKPQKLGKTLPGEDQSLVKRLARFRVDGLPIEHAQYATGFTGPMAWLNSGKIDAVLDVQFPSHPDDEVDLGVIIEHLGKSMTDLAKETGKELGFEEMQNPFSGTKLAGWTSQKEADEEVWPRWGSLREDGSGSAQDSQLERSSKVAEPASEVRAAVESANAALTASKPDERGIIPGQHRLARPALRAPTVMDDSITATGSALQPSVGLGTDQEAPQAVKDGLKDRQVTIDIDLRFRDLKASVPLYTTDLTIRNNAFIRPIVAFINANRTLIPIHCAVKAPLSDFDGSWTLFETGLTSSISQQIHAALIHHVSSSSANQQRIRTVGTWGVQRGAEAVLNVLRTVVDPMHGEMQGVVGGV